MTVQHEKRDMSWMRVLSKPTIGRPGWVVTTQGPRAAFSASPPPQPTVDPLAEERRALDEQKRELAALTSRYQQSVAALEQARQSASEEMISDLTALAFAVGRELALRELQNDPTPIAELIKRLAREMPHEERLAVRVAAEDFAVLSAAEALSSPDCRRLELEADPALEPGSCVIAGANATVSSTFAERERAVRRELALSDEPIAPELLRAAEHGRSLQ